MNDFWLMLALLVTLARAEGIYVNRTFAVLDGEVKVAGLKAPVSVTRDAVDVTHIKAQSPADAWFFIGCVHANGIKAFCAHSSQSLSPEFHILGIKPGGTLGKPWTPQDRIGWSLMMTLDFSGNWGTEFARLSALKTLNTAQLWQLFTPTLHTISGRSACVKGRLCKTVR